jgi:hypothetical protein
VSYDLELGAVPSSLAKHLCKRLHTSLGIREQLCTTFLPLYCGIPPLPAAAQACGPGTCRSIGHAAVGRRGELAGSCGQLSQVRTTLRSPANHRWAPLPLRCAGSSLVRCRDGTKACFMWTAAEGGADGEAGGACMTPMATRQRGGRAPGCFTMTGTAHTSRCALTH